MRQNYLNKAIQEKCPKRDNCFPKGIEHNCIDCRSEMLAQKSESDYLDMMARNERASMTEW